MDDRLGALEFIVVNILDVEFYLFLGRWGVCHLKLLFDLNFWLSIYCFTSGEDMLFILPLYDSIYSLIKIKHQTILNFFNSNFLFLLNEGLFDLEVGFFLA